MKFNKINIYLQQYSRNRINYQRPAWFSYEKTFVNLLSTINWNLSNLTICFEHEQDYDNYFTKKYENQFPFKVKFVDTSKEKWTGKTFENVSWSRSVATASEIIKKDIESGQIKENELIYLTQDDYAHLPYFTEISLDLFNNFINENSYVCLFDDNNKYLFSHEDRNDEWGMYKNLMSKIIISNARHWRDICHCSMSMMMPQKLFIRDENLWCFGYSDCEISNRIRQNYNSKIWTPMPGLSCHVVNPYMSPLVNWEELYKNIELK